MKLVVIEHSRCGEWDKTEYYAAPDSMEEEQIKSVIDQVQDEYLEALDMFKETQPPPDPPASSITAFQDDTMTIGEAKKMIASYSKIKADYDRQRKEVVGSFTERLKKCGICPIGQYEGTDRTQSYISWGHRHGDGLEY